MSCSSSLDGFFFKKDLQKWSYRHELVDDENEFIYREEWRSNGGEEIGYPTRPAMPLHALNVVQTSHSDGDAMLYMRASQLK